MFKLFLVTSWIVQGHLRFEGRHADADIMSLLENTVPPADIGKVSLFSQPLARFNKEARFCYFTGPLMLLCYVMLCYVMLCYSLDVDHLKKLQLPVGPSGGQEEHGSSPGVLLAAMGFDMGSHIGPLNTLHLSYHGTCEIQSPCSDSVPRLSAQLLHTTWQQTELNCEADLKKLKEWSQKFDLFASKQVRGCHQNIFWSIKIMPFNGLSNTYVHECAFIFIYGAYMYMYIY